MKAAQQRHSVGTTKPLGDPTQVAFEEDSDALSLGILADVDGPILEELESRTTKGPTSSVLPKLARAQELTKKACALTSGADPEDDQERNGADDIFDDAGHSLKLQLYTATKRRAASRIQYGERYQTASNKKGTAASRSSLSIEGHPPLELSDQKLEESAFKASKKKLTVHAEGSASRPALFNHSKLSPQDKTTRLPVGRKQPCSHQIATTDRRRIQQLQRQNRLSKEKTRSLAQSRRVTQTATLPKLSIEAISVGTAATCLMFGLVSVLLAATLTTQLLGSVVGFWKNEDTKNASLEGLPSYISYEMVAAALNCQEIWGHPAACTLAQIIVESGGGEQLSGLAQRDNNLFGIKWSSDFAACPEVSGKDSWQTQEEYNGQSLTTVASFTTFTSFEACIRFRSRVLLQSARYANNTLIQQAISTHSSDKMAEGLKDAGYATDSSYSDSLKTVMQTYNLYRFDTITLAEFESGQLSGSTIVAAAQTQLGTPYVWGGNTAYVALDCSGLTQWCYAQAGKNIPRNSEDQAGAGTKIPLSDAEPGDILWRNGHVAIYIGGDSYIHAPRPGRTVSIDTGISQFSCAIRF
jgi:hypothetical protein